MPAFDASFFAASWPPSEDGRHRTLRRLDTLARFLDSAFTVPVIGTKIGADALLNLVPGAGLVFAKSLSAWIIWEAFRLGAPKPLLGRMLANLGIDFAISLVPVAGWVADVFFRANLMNIALLREHLESAPPAASRTAQEPRGAPVTIEGEWKVVR